MAPLRRTPASRRMRRGAVAVLAIAGAGCTPAIHPFDAPSQTPAIAGKVLIAADGVRLPLTVWPARGLPAGAPPRAAIIALHGMNDHKGAWREAASTWVERGVVVYAYDQRGFGAGAAVNPPGRNRPGIWPGVSNLIRDLESAVAAVRRRHPAAPIYVVGESMGSTVILATFGRPDAPKVAGIVLGAPAVLAQRDLPENLRRAMGLAYRMVPGVVMTGGGLGRRPTDNLPRWYQTAWDRLMIRGTRIDAIWGLFKLMDAAARGAPRVRVPVLLLYGARDQILPSPPLVRLAPRLPARLTTFVYYRRGWHWLFRDLQRWVVHDDVNSWMFDRRIQSGEDRNAYARLKRDAARKR